MCCVSARHDEAHRYDARACVRGSRSVAPRDHGAGGCCDVTRGDVPGAGICSFWFRPERACSTPPSLVEVRGGCPVSTPSRRQRGCDNLCSVCAEARFAEFLRAVRKRQLRLIFRRDTRVTRGRVTLESESSRVEHRRWLYSGRLAWSGSLTEAAEVAGFGPKPKWPDVYDEGLSFVGGSCALSRSSSGGLRSDWRGGLAIEHELRGTTFGWPPGGRVAYCRVVRPAPRSLIKGAAEVRGRAAAVRLWSGAQGHGRQVLDAQAPGAGRMTRKASRSTLDSSGAMAERKS
jgi:hypothetical protein